MTIVEIMAKLAAAIRNSNRLKRAWQEAEAALKAFEGSAAERQALVEAAATAKREWAAAQRIIAGLRSALAAARGGYILLPGIPAILAGLLILGAIGGG